MVLPGQMVQPARYAQKIPRVSPQAISHIEHRQSLGGNMLYAREESDMQNLKVLGKKTLEDRSIVFGEKLKKNEMI